MKPWVKLKKIREDKGIKGGKWRIQQYPPNSNINPKRQREKTPIEGQASISSAQHWRMWKKMSIAKNFQKMAKNLKELIAENASLLAKKENIKVIVLEEFEENENNMSIALFE